MISQAPDQTHETEAEYRLRFSTNADSRTRVWEVLVDTLFSRYIEPAATVLDLGAGWCEFVNQVDASKKYALDCNPDTKRRARDDVQVLEQNSTEPWPVPAASLDVVFTSNFLEHLPDKEQVRRTLAEAFRCLKPGGTLICMGPNIRCVGGRYWDFWDHHVPLSDASLAEILRLLGFEVRRQVPRFLPYTMVGRRAPSGFLIRAYLSLPFFWRFFGEQFLLFSRKPETSAL